jgi:pimeloyl-ACP methyl ester carboxylesterase
MAVTSETSEQQRELGKSGTPPVDVASRRRFITGDGTALRVVETGPEDAELAVVFAHGWVLDNTSWVDVVRALSPLRTIRYGHRGHGASACGPTGCWSLAQLADDLAELITARVPGKAVLVGHSMGGMTLMALAEKYPSLVRDRVAGMAFVATSAGELPALPAWLPPRAAAMLIKAGQALDGRIKAREPAFALPRAGLRYLLFGKRARKADLDLVARQLRRAHPESMLGFRDSLTEHERCAALAAYQGIPAVVLAGGAEAVPAEPCAADCRRAPGRRVRDLPGGRAHAAERALRRGRGADRRPGTEGYVIETGTIIVGTGFSGLGMAIQLTKDRRDDFLLLEKASEIGGTWRDNTYPGCACDVPSRMYSYSFEQNPDWSRTFSGQPEIQRYLLALTEKYHLRRHIRFGVEVTGARWDEATNRWHVSTSGGEEYVSRFLVAGVGALHIPNIPALPGWRRSPGGPSTRRGGTTTTTCAASGSR